MPKKQPESFNYLSNDPEFVPDPEIEEFMEQEIAHAPKDPDLLAQRLRNNAASPDFDYITHSPNRMDKFGEEWIIYLGAEAPDMHIDEIGVALEVDLPDLIGDVGAGEDFTGLPHQQGEQQKLLGR